MRIAFSKIFWGCLLAAGATAALAQTYPARPGLWASAHQATMDGKKLPGQLDIKGGMSPQQRQAIIQAMAQLGLPAGWSPSLSCETATQVSVQETLRKAQMDGCKVNVTDQRSDSLRFKMSCTPTAGQGAHMGPMSGTGEVTGIGGQEVKMGTRIQASIQGRMVNYESQTVSKWVGADCKHPPAGLDPSMVGM